MSSDFPTQRSISQIIRRHTPGSLLYLDEHKLTGRVSRIEGQPDREIDIKRLHSQIVRFLRWWVDKDGILAGIDPDIEPDEITPIAPEYVLWEPFPPIYRCSNSSCQVIHDATDEMNFTGTCRRCGSRLRQMPYVFYHQCGTLTYLRVPSSVSCPDHGQLFIYLHDTGRFSTSSWRCRECVYEKSFYYPLCPNATCKEQNPSWKWLQGSFWNDQWVHYCQTLDNINLDQALAERFLHSDRGRTLLVHGGVLGEILAGNKRLFQALDQTGGACPNCGSEVPPGWKFCGSCGKPLPENLWQESATSRIASYPMTSASGGRCAWALLRDMEASRSLRNEATQREAEGLPDTDSYRWGLIRAECAGVWDVILVTSFPLTTAAVGYTRHQSRPNTTDGRNPWFRPFPRIGRKESKQRYPIFTHTVESEAWLVQVSAKALAQWIIANEWEPWAGDLIGLADADEPLLKEWFLEALIPVVEYAETVSPEQVSLYDRVEALLHSLSHVILLALSLHSGIDATSLGEMLMVDALGFALYTGDSDLGALTAAFRQLTGTVFTDALEEYATCKFDPTCRHDDGGACAGCIQLYRGCQLFNEKLSRAFLFGGPTGDLAPGEVAYGFFSVVS